MAGRFHAGGPGWLTQPVDRHGGAWVISTDTWGGYRSNGVDRTLRAAAARVGPPQPVHLCECDTTLLSIARAGLCRHEGESMRATA